MRWLAQAQTDAQEREQVAGQGIDFRWMAGRELSEVDWDFVHACYASTYEVRGQAPYLRREFFSLLAERMASRSAWFSPAAAAGRWPWRSAWSMATPLRALLGLPGEFDRLHFETCFYQGLEYAIGAGCAFRRRRPG
jgi:predicted N-acyltransferase